MKRIRITQPDGTSRTHELSVGTHSVGSAPENALPLRFPTVSRSHAELCVSESGETTLKDLGSRNGVFIILLDGTETRLPPLVKTPWHDGEVLKIGPFSMIFQAAEPSFDKGKLARRYADLLNADPATAPEKFHRETEGSSTARDLEEIHHDFHGDGPIRDYLSDPNCREVLINAYNEIFVDLGAGLQPSERSFWSPEGALAWAVRTANLAGRRLDSQHPICEATLPDGARFHAVLPPLSERGLSVAIRRFGAAPIDEEAALATKWMSPEALSILREAVVNRANLVISGGTSTGKTSLLNFLCQMLPVNERIITIEDTLELRPRVKNLVQLQARRPNAEGAGEVTLRTLVQCALRMRPDRLIVGECRGDEVLEMLQAFNTGHPGSLTTLHANSPADAMRRLELLALLGAPNLSIEAVRAWIFSSIAVIVQVERDHSGHRFIGEIAGVQPDETLIPIYKREAT